MAVTLKDVAKEANVSVSTVSRTINGTDLKKRSPETEARIWAAVAKLGYIPNQNARDLICGITAHDQPTYTIGLILASDEINFNNAFFGEMLTHFVSEMQQVKFHLQYALSCSQLSKGALYQEITSQKVDGAILMGRPTAELLQIVQANIPNLVYTGLDSIGLVIDEVVCEGHTGVCEAITKLVSTGRKNIAYLGPLPKDPSYENTLNHFDRYSSFCYAMAQNTCPVQPYYVRHATLNPQMGYQAMVDICAQHPCPDAVFCAVDTLATGVLRFAGERGICVPKDLAVIGYGERKDAAYLIPSLTTVSIPTKDIAVQSMALLVERINGAHTDAKKIVVPVTFVERESSHQSK